MTRHLLIVTLIACVLCVGCKRGETPTETVDPATDAGSSVSITPEDMFGVYVVTDYASITTIWDRSPDSWAAAQVGSKALISREACTMLGYVLVDPGYEIKFFPGSDEEGNVPTGRYRRMSDFLGFESGLGGITMLDVHRTPEMDSHFFAIEINDRDTLWLMFNGWMFQLQRLGVDEEVVPLDERRTVSVP